MSRWFCYHRAAAPSSDLQEMPSHMKELGMLLQHNYGMCMYVSRAVATGAVGPVSTS